MSSSRRPVTTAVVTGACHGFEAAIAVTTDNRDELRAYQLNGHGLHAPA